MVKLILNIITIGSLTFFFLNLQSGPTHLMWHPTIVQKKSIPVTVWLIFLSPSFLGFEFFFFKEFSLSQFNNQSIFTSALLVYFNYTHTYIYFSLAITNNTHSSFLPLFGFYWKVKILSTKILKSNVDFVRVYNDKLSGSMPSNGGIRKNHQHRITRHHCHKQSHFAVSHYRRKAHQRSKSPLHSQRQEGLGEEIIIRSLEKRERGYSLRLNQGWCNPT